MLRKISARQNLVGKWFRKFLQGKSSKENASENFCKAKLRRKMLQKISATKFDEIKTNG
jgi:hypothetical protein